uniref:Putative secreted protein n=1 Tax=Anopheles darlingi TaxID=43151 RepID=A0A2M4D428_ANODA
MPTSWSRVSGLLVVVMRNRVLILLSWVSSVMASTIVGPASTMNIGSSRQLTVVITSSIITTRYDRECFGSAATPRRCR